MSVILDALKKLERDKAASTKGPVDIVPQITVSRNRGARRANWKIPAIIISVVAATAAVTAIIVITIAQQGTRPVTAISMDEENVRPVPSPSPERVPADPQTNTETAPGRFAGDAVKAPGSERSVAHPAENTQPRFPSHERKPSLERNEDVATSSDAASSDLKVSGIAWQDARADRRAVVNGALVGEGTVVEGARIVRILQDRVRFSRSGETFEKAVDGSSQVK